jgi:hypothetical protein
MHAASVPPIAGTEPRAVNASADRTEMSVKFVQQSDGDGARRQDTRNSVYMKSL